METAERPLRRDAQRNRERILEAAAEVFAERGLAATLDDVADRAGLGVGTVYRRFSSRDALIDALFEARMLEIVRLADDALAADDPWEGLRRYLERATELQARDRGFKEALLGTTERRARLARVRERIRPRAEELIRRAQASGQIRPDLNASDLPIIQLMLGDIAEIARPERPDLWRRYLTLILDGIRTDATTQTPLPQPPLSRDQLTDTMCRWRPTSKRANA